MQDFYNPLALQSIGGQGLPINPHITSSCPQTGVKDHPVPIEVRARHK